MSIAIVIVIVIVKGLHIRWLGGRAVAVEPENLTTEDVLVTNYTQRNNKFPVV